MPDRSAPIEIDFKKANDLNQTPVSLRTFNSYSFERNILVPAAAFRFTAPGIEKSLRTQIRSGDIASLYAVDSNANKQPVGTGIIDETDTHVMPNRVEYVLTGRDTLGQLVDNSAIDAQNRIINTENVTLKVLLGELIKNTRIPPQFVTQQTPNAKVLLHTNGGETKINTLQRYLEFTNCLVWTLPDGRVVIGKPNFSQNRSGNLIMNSSDSSQNNVVEARSRRNLNQAIRQIVTQLQTLTQADAGIYTKINDDRDIKPLLKARVGRSVWKAFSYGQGEDAVNTVVQVGNQSGNNRKIGDELSLREIARDNMKILDVEMVVQGHLNENDQVFNIDQIYNVQIEDDDVEEDMYVYSCSYELTLDHGMLTRLRLCRLGTICAYTDAIGRAQA